MKFYLAEICNHFLHKRLHGSNIDHFKLVSINRSIQVDVLTDLTKYAEQGDVRFPSASRSTKQEVFILV